MNEKVHTLSTERLAEIYSECIEAVDDLTKDLEMGLYTLPVERAFIDASLSIYWEAIEVVGQEVYMRNLNVFEMHMLYNRFGGRL